MQSPRIVTHIMYLAMRSRVLTARAISGINLVHSRVLKMSTASLRCLRPPGRLQRSRAGSIAHSARSMWCQCVVLVCGDGFVLFLWLPLLFVVH